jgi:hypothetical protein
MYNNREAIGGFADAYLWSSTDGGTNTAYAFGLDFGYTDNDLKSNPNFVRGVRAF